MLDLPKSSPRPKTPYEMRENFAKAIIVFAQYCKAHVKTLEEAETYLQIQKGMSYIPGSYKGADVRLYPPQPKCVAFQPNADLPKLFFNAGNNNSFKELGEIFQEEDLYIIIENIR